MSSADLPSRSEAFRFWFKLGLISFGGPAAQVALMHAEVVDKRRWISEERFLHALNYCMLLPGPEAQQLSIYCGWLLHGVQGGVVAGVLFVLPSAVLLWALSWAYVVYGQVGWVEAMLGGLKPAVLAIVLAAVFRLGKKILTRPARLLMAAGAFVALYFFQCPYPAVVVLAACVGWLASPKDLTPLDSTVQPASTGKPGLPQSLKTLGLWLFLWWLPVLVACWVLGRQHILVKQGIFFGKAALVTFGGAYAVLPYVSQQAVSYYHWLEAPQMLDGLGLAETTPGPLIMVLQFVGFLGGWNHPTPLSPLLCATLAAGITTWTTFAPCFLWVFLGAPYYESLRAQARLQSALSFISSAVVGVILNLALWLGTQVWFQAGQVRPRELAISLLACLAMARGGWSMTQVVAFGALAGLLLGQTG